MRSIYSLNVLGATLCCCMFFHSCTGNETDTATMTDIRVDSVSSFGAVTNDSLLDRKDSISAAKSKGEFPTTPFREGEAVDTRDVDPEQLISFAESLVGTPYVYGSTDPKVGFDCSGFITYVFNNFKIAVPRSSSQFANVGKTVAIENAKRGDIVLFTDPDFENTQTQQVGHMGLITSSQNSIINFIHSTSGKAMAVTVSPLNDRYMKRFVRIARIFPQNDG